MTFHLRPYQSKGISQVRKALAKNRCVMRQLPTGGGKTAEFSTIIEMAHAIKTDCWVIAPRNELLNQASRHLAGCDVPHARIDARNSESVAYSVHVVSLETLKRRIKADKIINWPKLVIIDEAHVAFDAQKELAEVLPDSTKIIGFTATPERSDGQGLSELYGAIVYGPSLLWMVENGYLTDVKYFSPNIEGLDKIKKSGKNGDLDSKELAELFEKKKVYGNVISHYRREANNKQTLVYCRSVKASEETAERFRTAGYDFYSIDGSMDDSVKQKMLARFREGKMDGICSCDIMTYGVDLPMVECIIMLRPTLSLSLYMQMLGRGLRPYSNEETRYRKTHCVFLDHVGNRQQFFGSDGHPFDPIDWNFEGDKKRKRKKVENIVSLKLCDKCFMYFEGPTCDNCGGTNANKERKDLEYVDGELVEITGPRKMNERPMEQRSEIQGRIDLSVSEWQEKKSVDSIVKLLDIAAEIKRLPQWVYYRLAEGEKEVNEDLLYQIAKIKKYKHGWVKRTADQVKLKLMLG